MRIEKRWAPTPEEAQSFDTEALRKAFLVENLFRAARSPSSRPTSTG